MTSAPNTVRSLSSKNLELEDMHLTDRIYDVQAKESYAYRLI